MEGTCTRRRAAAPPPRCAGARRARARDVPSALRDTAPPVRRPPCGILVSTLHTSALRRRVPHSRRAAPGASARAAAPGAAAGDGSEPVTSLADLPTVHRQPSGVPGFDIVAGGGLPTGRLYLVVGEPGAGKTILAHQIGARVVRDGGTALYLTVHTEAHHTLLAQARTLRFFEASVVAAERFRYVSLSGALDDSGIAGVRERLTQLVSTYAPTLLVIDGLHMLRVLGDDVREFHRLLVFLQGQATLLRLTTLVLSNYDNETAADATYALPDGILHLRTERHGLREVRRLSVSKLRGSAALLGWHAFTVGGDGVRIYPRLEARVQAVGLPTVQPGDRICAFGIAGLDAMLGGGVASGSVTLLAGAPGAGKTLFGLAFLACGAARGERGLYIAFRETVDRVRAKAEGVGLPIGALEAGDMVEMRWIPPLELLVDELAERILSAVLGPAWEDGALASLTAATETVRPSAEAVAAEWPPSDGARSAASSPGVPGAPRYHRVFVDGLDDLRRTCLQAERFPSFLAALTDVLRAHGVAVMLSQELREPFGHDLALPIEEMSASVDNILLLRYEEHGEAIAGGAERVPSPADGDRRADGAGDGDDASAPDAARPGATPDSGPAGAHAGAERRLHRLVSVLKMRERAYDTAIRLFVISGRGVEVHVPGSTDAAEPTGAKGGR